LREKRPKEKETATYFAGKRGGGPKDKVGKKSCRRIAKDLEGKIAFASFKGGGGEKT